MFKMADWNQVRSKGWRISHTGVHPTVVTPEKFIGQVDGDHGTYDVTLDRVLADEPGSWTCTCKWGYWVTQMTTWHLRWRICSHAYAASIWYGKNKPTNWEDSIGLDLEEDPMENIFQPIQLTQNTLPEQIDLAGPEFPEPPEPPSPYTPHAPMPRSAKMKFAQAAFTKMFRNPFGPRHPLHQDTQDYINALKFLEEDWLPELLYSSFPVRDQYDKLRHGCNTLKGYATRFIRRVEHHPYINMDMENIRNEVDMLDSYWKMVYDHIDSVRALVQERLLSSKSHFQDRMPKYLDKAVIFDKKDPGYTDEAQDDYGYYADLDPDEEK